MANESLKRRSFFTTGYIELQVSSTLITKNHRLKSIVKQRFNTNGVKNEKGQIIVTKTKLERYENFEDFEL